MRDNFRDWLIEQGRNTNSLNTYLYHLRNIETAYGDLDEIYDVDRFKALLDALVYTAQDERDNRASPSKVSIKSSLYKTLASHRTVLGRYAEFRDEDDLFSPLGDETGEEDGILAAETPAKALALGFRYEQDLQTALIACINQIEPGMRLDENGKERHVPSGRIDALALDAQGRNVVIELKAVTAKREVLGQIAAYMADIEDEKGRRPRGILIAPDFDPKLVSGARMIDGLSLLRYSFSFAFSGI